jgi:lantibiotic modifying enzyme
MMDAHEFSLSRRELLERGAAAVLLMLTPAALRAGTRAPTIARPYLDAAMKAERWIARASASDARGKWWIADPAKPAAVTTDLYSGTSGVVLFYLELHNTTGDERYLAEAIAGARYLAGTMPNTVEQLGDEGAGLYTGLAGTVFTLARVSDASGSSPQRDELRTAAQRGMRLLHAAERARISGSGSGWNGVNDIVAGTSGIALTMLWASQALNDRSAMEAAIRAGDHLVSIGQPQTTGTKWEIMPGVARRYPNFSHGTAGVSFFLASLHGLTSEARYRDAAIAGATYLQALAETTSSGGHRVMHHEPGGEQLFYMSWCHGPAGTARLFHQLTEVTGDPQWKAYVASLARGIVDSGVPEVHPDGSGFWNNISQCCGNCGVSEFFVAQHQQTRDPAYLAFAKRTLDNVLARTTVDGDGLKWIQAENRTSPENVVAQTGLMQGAAGVGLALLHLDGAIEHRAPAIVLPDSPAW